MADTATTEATESAEAAKDTSTEAKTEAQETTSAAEGTEEVRDPAKLLNAYNAEKAKRREQDVAIRERDEQIAQLKAKAEGREAEYLEERKAEQSAREKFNERILSAELKAAAKGKLADPADALTFIDRKSFEVGDDGEVDSQAIDEAIDNLVSKKPYLAAQGGKRFQGSADGGARNDATKVSQLTQADIKGMSPEQVVEARQKGQFDDLLGGS